LISRIWTHHPPTSCTSRCIPTSTDSSSTPSTTTMRSRWTPHSTLGPPAPGRQQGLREVRVVNARPTPSTTHSADGTDDVAAQWLRARRARRVRRRGGGAGCDDARLVAGGTGGLMLPSSGARVWFPPKVYRHARCQMPNVVTVDDTTRRVYYIVCCISRAQGRLRFGATVPAAALGLRQFRQRSIMNTRRNGSRSRSWTATVPLNARNPSRT
jgi:hypothetical protein